MKVKIGYSFYNIIELEHVYCFDNEVNGEIDHDLLKISLKKGLPTPKKAQVLLHELIHGISDTYNVTLTENEVDMLAIGTLAFLVDNPKFLVHFYKTYMEGINDKGLPIKVK